MEDNQLKAGHPPAVKVGGMRIPQHRTHSESEKQWKATEGNAALKVSTSPPKSIATNASGVIVKGNNPDTPTEAVQTFHEKPMPTHDVRSQSTKPNIIHQPRK